MPEALKQINTFLKSCEWQHLLRKRKGYIARLVSASKVHCDQFAKRTAENSPGISAGGAMNLDYIACFSGARITEPRADRGPRAGSPRGVVVASGINTLRCLTSSSKTNLTDAAARVLIP